jgi:hypothetical protein
MFDERSIEALECLKFTTARPFLIQGTVADEVFYRSVVWNLPSDRISQIRFIRLRRTERAGTIVVFPTTLRRLLGSVIGHQTQSGFLELKRRGLETCVVSNLPTERCVD